MPTVTVDIIGRLEFESTLARTNRTPLDIFGYPVLQLLPDRANYAATDAGESISKDADGGLNRSRRDLSGSTSLVDVTWTLKSSDYATLAAFYLARTSAIDGTFQIDLVIDQPELTTHLAKFMPGTFVLNGQAGDTFTAQAQLEVTPLTPNAEYDASFVAVYGSQLANRYLFLTALATFANTTLDTYF